MGGEFSTRMNKVSNPPLAHELLAINPHTPIQEFPSLDKLYKHAHTQHTETHTHARARAHTHIHYLGVGCSLSFFAGSFY